MSSDVDVWFAMGNFKGTGLHEPLTLHALVSTHSLSRGEGDPSLDPSSDTGARACCSSLPILCPVSSPEFVRGPGDRRERGVVGLRRDHTLSR